MRGCCGAFRALLLLPPLARKPANVAAIGRYASPAVETSRATSAKAPIIIAASLVLSIFWKSRPAQAPPPGVPRLTLSPLTRARTLAAVGAGRAAPGALPSIMLHGFVRVRARTNLTQTQASGERLWAVPACICSRINRKKYKRFIAVAAPAADPLAELCSAECSEQSSEAAGCVAMRWWVSVSGVSPWTGEAGGAGFSPTRRPARALARDAKSTA